MKAHGNAWPEKKRIEVATAHVMGLTAPMIAAATGVSSETIRHWRMADWFKDLVDELRREDDSTVDAKLTKLVSKSLDTLVDRLENGDFMYDSKEGTFVRKPLGAKDVVKVADVMFDKRNLLRGRPTSISGKEQVSDRLLKLAEEFARFANAKTIEAVVVPLESGASPATGVDRPVQVFIEVDNAIHDGREAGLQEGVPGVRRLEGGNSQESPPQPSAP